ncbi:alpha-amylase family protein [Fusibacter ferrireducens]
MKNKINANVMLNAYPDSLGGTLNEITGLLSLDELKDAFGAFYILPSVFNTDLDRGFSVIDYELNDLLARRDDLERLKALGIEFKFDFILNHGSVLSPQFQDLLQKGGNSIYKDFFIDWNKFWTGYGTMTEEGYIQPEEKYIRDMFFRKKGLPILMVRFPNGEEVPYWNTFYQKVSYPKIDPQDIMKMTKIQYLTAEKLSSQINEILESEQSLKAVNWGDHVEDKETILEFIEGSRRYLGQMDLNINSPLVWDFYKETLARLADYGATIVRLDAFAYAPKKPGERNFLNDPDTWDLLNDIQKLAEPLNITLLPEIHSKYEEKIYELLAQKGYMTYDFFLPGLIINAFESQSKKVLESWARELTTKNIRTVNMLGCHDGIPLLDLKGLLKEEEIQQLIDTVVERGGLVKDLHGQKNVYYQVNATYYSALGENDMRMLLARAIQLFMPGKPQVWYLDLFAGVNDYEAVKASGVGGHKEINRTNLNREAIKSGLKKEIVKRQLALLKFRNTFPAFGFDSTMHIEDEQQNQLTWSWQKEGYRAVLKADLISLEFSVEGFQPDGCKTFNFKLK